MFVSQYGDAVDDLGDEFTDRIVNGSVAWEALVDQAFAYWGQVSGINFVKVEETSTQCGDIRIGLQSSWATDEDDDSAGVLQGFSFAGDWDDTGQGSMSGDIWCIASNDPITLNLGLTASSTLVHEI